MDISIIIVNWNSANYLRKCLGSIFDQTKNIEFEIIVIDNASFDGSDQIVKEEFPDVQFIQSDQNIGFARANNLGFQYASGEILLFLNPDIEVIGSAIERMFSQLKSLPDAGAVGCRLVNADFSVQTDCIQNFPTILNQALGIDYLMDRFPNFKLWGKTPLYSKNEKPIAVNVIIGACIMIRRNLFEKIGRFTSDYFMYSEDVDLCYKIKKAQSNVYYLNEIEMIHYGGKSSMHIQNSFFRALQIKQSRMIFFKKTKGNLYAKAYKFVMFLISIVRILLIYMLLPFQKLISKNENLIHSLHKWKSVLKWSFGIHEYIKN
ncbi:MAG: glycosyltransferase family 2 protein [bacterium]|nr:glycosyltransferase family 2 protein [bacterium]